jgi:hypothetical protein
MESRPFCVSKGASVEVGSCFDPGETTESRVSPPINDAHDVRSQPHDSLSLMPFGTSPARVSVFDGG